MLRQEYLRRLVDGAYIELYLSANDGARMYWPWRMQPPKDSRRAYRDACEHYIIDSDPLDDGVDTAEVLDTAFRLDAEVASLADVYQEYDATVDSLLHGFEVYDDHPFDGDLLIPLQKPVAEMYLELGAPSEHMIGIGGLKGASNAERLRSLKSLRDVAGPDVHIHGFGWGIQGLKREINRNPQLLDSVDYSTPIQTSIKGVTPGKERMSVQATKAASQLVADLRDVSEYVEPQAFDEPDDPLQSQLMQNSSE